MAYFTKMIGGAECECHEYQDPINGSSGKMRMHLTGSFAGNIDRESHILVPLFTEEEDLARISDLWLTEQEWKLGLPLGASCTSSGWWAGHEDPSHDAELTNKYDFLIPMALAHAIPQHRLLTEIMNLSRAQEELSEELDAEYEEGESDWAAQLEVKIDDLERRIAENDELLRQSHLLRIGNRDIDYLGYCCELVSLRGNIVHLQSVNNDQHFELSVPDFLSRADYIPDFECNHPPFKVRLAIKDFMCFEEETSIIYPFARSFSELDNDTVQKIVDKCSGAIDTETLYSAITDIIGENPKLSDKDYVADVFAKRIRPVLLVTFEDRLEALKTALFTAGQEAIDDFLGFDIAAPAFSKDALDILIDQVAVQMPDGEFNRYFQKYVLNNAPEQPQKRSSVDALIAGAKAKAEPPPMFEFSLPVTWEVSGFVKVKAANLQEAIDYFNENSDHIPLPGEAEYVDGSFGLSADEYEAIEAMATSKPVNGFPNQKGFTFGER